MAERAAHLVDRVLPDVPIRQWVLSVPFQLRYLERPETLIDPAGLESLVRYWTHFASHR
jgi:hypothetical protein